MIVLDTNVVSELMRPAPSRQVVAWLDQLPSAEVYLTSITVAELLYGIARPPHGRRRSSLAAAVEAMLSEEFAHSILPFDSMAAAHYADIVADRDNGGRPISMADAQIAATCRSHGATLATRNTGDFVATGVVIVNPWVGR